MKLVSVSEVKAIESEADSSGLTYAMMMENAGQGLAEAVQDLPIGDQDREVFAVPGNITEKRSSGPNKLIRDGRAKLITNAQDIFDELASQLHLAYDQHDNKTQMDLTPTEQLLFKFLSGNPVHIDALSEKTELSTSDALVTLLSLEFKGLVRQLPGKLFIRS